jgi:hypothetical protein
MNAATAIRMLAHKEPPGLFSAVEPALQDAGLREFLAEHAFGKDETLRYNCVRVLWRAVDREPRLFYQYWDRFAAMIASPNGFHRSAAAQLIASLVAADEDCRLDRIFTRYMRLLGDPKVMVTHYFVETLDRVCRARPDLQGRVVAALLKIDRSTHTQQHKDMLKADILAVFSSIFATMPADLQQKARGMAEAALSCTSPKARKAGRLFLASHGAAD